MAELVHHRMPGIQDLHLSVAFGQAIQACFQLVGIGQINDRRHIKSVAFFINEGTADLRIVPIRRIVVQPQGVQIHVAPGDTGVGGFIG